MSQKVGLALGAGGARGISHIGVIKALKRHNFKADMVAGSSMGSIIGACFALGIPMEKVERELHELKRKGLRKFVDPGFKKGSLLKGEKIRKHISSFLDEAEFQDTKIPLVITATDLSTGEEIRIKSGKIADAIAASSAVPGIFQPVEKDGRFLVDGGLCNPTPASVLEDVGADAIIAVDFMLKLDQLEKIPGLFSTLTHSYEIIRAHNSRDKLNAIQTDMTVIKPVVRKTFDSFKFYDIVKFIEAGEKAVEEKIGEIKRMVGEE